MCMQYALQSKQLTDLLHRYERYRYLLHGNVMDLYEVDDVNENTVSFMK